MLTRRRESLLVCFVDVMRKIRKTDFRFSEEIKKNNYQIVRRVNQ